MVPVSDPTMKNHIAEAPMTEILLKDIVLKRVLSRLGAWSTHRPTAEEKHIEARVLTIPLDMVSMSTIANQKLLGCRRPWDMKPLDLSRHLNDWDIRPFTTANPTRSKTRTRGISDESRDQNSIQTFLRSAEKGRTDRIEAATRVSGYAAAVNMI